MPNHAVLEYPVYVRMPTEDNKPYFESRSSAEAVISIIISAQNQGWLRLHGFVVLPDGLEIVMSPIRQGVTGVVAYLQSEMIPILSVLQPGSMHVFARSYSHAPIKTEKSLTARLNMLALAPVAHGICEAAEDYPFSSSSPRYKANVASYAGFSKSVPKDNPALSTDVAGAAANDAAETNPPAAAETTATSETP